MLNKLLYRIHVYGRVQGVGFRYSAAREARIKGITGFVRNEPDGSVYIEAEGSRSVLDDYLDWCRKGPVFASVESVEKEEFPAEGFTEFAIVH